MAEGQDVVMLIQSNGEFQGEVLRGGRLYSLALVITQRNALDLPINDGGRCECRSCTACWPMLVTSGDPDHALGAPQCTMGMPQIHRTGNRQASSWGAHLADR